MMLSIGNTAIDVNNNIDSVDLLQRSNLDSKRNIFGNILLELLTD